jgi:hypothetical protein
MPQGTDHLNANESLQHGQFVISQNRIYQLIFQSDGNLVIYKKYPGTPQRALWASGTMGHTADTCIMQADGNLVLYDPGNRAIWASNSYGHAQSRLVMQDDGNLVIYAPNNAAVWASNTVSQLPPSGPPATGAQALPGQILAKDHGLQTADGRYTFVFQSDSNLVLYKNYPNRPRKPLWASGTNGRPGAVCIMQADGNLVIYDADAHAIWSSNTYGHPGSRLVVQTDGNTVIYQPNNVPIWATNTVQKVPPTGPVAKGDTMHPGEILQINGAVISANGRYTFIFQTDGNLVLYKNYPNHPRKALWASGTAGRAAEVCIMQADGNLVIYDPDGGALWSSNTYTHPGSRLIAQDDGNTVIYQPNNAAIWATNTVQKVLPTGPSANGATAMQPGQALFPGQSIHSASNRYQLIFQTDGNLVLYMSVPGSSGVAVWASNTNGRVADVCIMQADGNLVIYDPDANAIWASGTWGKNGSHLIAQDDGNVVIYTPGGAPVWSTDTYPIDLNFTMQTQEQSNWCWAGVSNSVSHFYDNASTWTQCSVANTQLGRNDCCGAGASGACNVYGYLDKGLQEVGHFDHIDSGTTSYGTLRDQIRNGRPVGIRIAWSGGGAHFIAAVGADPGDFVLVGDPGGGSVSLVAYNTLKSSYNGSGTWTNTYYTK